VQRTLTGQSIGTAHNGVIGDSLYKKPQQTLHIAYTHLGQLPIEAFKDKNKHISERINKLENQYHVPG
jgi:hypothetical protein